jgi:hypothetical protein
MSDIIFIIKCLVLTFVVAVILQMKVNDTTLENHMVQLAGQSEIQDQLQLAARGGTLVLKEAQKKAEVLKKEALALLKPVFDQNSNTQKQ